VPRGDRQALEPGDDIVHGALFRRNNAVHARPPPWDRSRTRTAASFPNVIARANEDDSGRLFPL
jgi:hypothetical protein